ncbi:phage holin family protein [Anaerobacillus sp. CMMVII]|uniref:phage holin family protein n=1 Tax=Anaerobacillus sp. CMMVII TaxID=2755588 RepID=UPI0021B82B25|nr:phage holin family protein [Anaerobacillus sp. CMMVII]
MDLLFVGVLASGFTLGFTVSGIANGIIAAGAAITTHQAYKQTKNRDREELVELVIKEKIKRKNEKENKE